MRNKKYQFIHNTETGRYYLVKKVNYFSDFGKWKVVRWVKDNNEIKKFKKMFGGKY